MKRTVLLLICIIISVAVFFTGRCKLLDAVDMVKQKM